MCEGPNIWEFLLFMVAFFAIFFVFVATFMRLLKPEKSEYY